jgi:hypothetical protein
MIMIAGIERRVMAKASEEVRRTLSIKQTLQRPKIGLTA